MGYPEAVISETQHADAAAGNGFDPDLAKKLVAGAASGLLKDVHGVLAERHGNIVLEGYGAGQDYAWGDDLGVVEFNRETLHDLRSVTKSIVSLLYGIALERGEVPPVDTPILTLFPEYEDLAADPARMARTVEHAFTMSLGMEWDETRSYSDPLNSEIAMEHAPDRFRYILDRPLVAEPGTVWTYSGGATALIGEILTRGTGKTLPEFAEETLFSPLGIKAYEWAAGADGAHSAASGLRLTAGDLLKIGRLVLDNGIFEGRSIVPEAWVRASTAHSLSTPDGLGYGYFWFLGKAPVPVLGGPTDWIAGFGNGGQRLWLCPKADIAAVVYCGKYNDWSAWVTPTRIWSDIILGNLERA